MRDMTRESATVASDIRLVRIIEALRDLDGAGVTEVASALGMPKTTVYKHLNTLVETGLCTKRGGEYELGLWFLTHGGYARDRSRLYRVASPELRAFARREDELVTLGVYEAGSVVLLEAFNRKYELENRFHVGDRLSLHNSAQGKAVLSRLDSEELDAVLAERTLEPTTARTVTDEATLRDEVEEIRAAGFALNREELLDGLNAIAVPLVDSRTETVGVVTVTGPASHLPLERIRPVYADPLVELAADIEVTLDHAD